MATVNLARDLKHERDVAISRWSRPHARDSATGGFV